MFTIVQVHPDHGSVHFVLSAIYHDLVSFVATDNCGEDNIVRGMLVTLSSVHLSLTTTGSSDLPITV